MLCMGLILGLRVQPGDVLTGAGADAIGLDRVPVLGAPTSKQHYHLQK